MLFRSVSGNCFSWVRSDGDGQEIAVVINFSSEPWHDYRIGLPEAGVWTEIFNSDAAVYDGSGGTGNMGKVIATADPSNGFDNSALVQVPPLGAVFFRHEPAPAEDAIDAVEGAEGYVPKRTGATRIETLADEVATA